MSWLSVLPVMATLLGQAPVREPPADGGPRVTPLDGTAVPGPASAVAVPAAAPAAGEGESFRWYGAPMVVIDALNVGLIAGVAAYSDHHPNSGLVTAAALSALAIYTLGGMVVHDVNGQPRHAAKSVLLRGGALVAGILAAVPILASGGCSSEDSLLDRPGYCALGGPILFVFPLAALAIDDAFFARSPVEAPPPVHTVWAPTLRLQSGVALAGLGGTF
jgi:hypothetical protein